MQITDLRASTITTDIAWDSNNPSRGTMDAILVQIFTDAGITGTYFAWERLTTGRGLAEMMVKAVKPYLLGKNPLHREEIWYTLTSWNRKGLPMVGTGAVDVCLWDIAGKASGLPVYQLMGAYRDKMRAYASTTILKRPEDYESTVRGLKEEGYTAVKLHIKGDPAWDIEACRAARAGGPDIDIMLDSSCHYNRHQR